MGGPLETSLLQDPVAQWIPEFQRLASDWVTRSQPPPPPIADWLLALDRMTADMEVIRTNGQWSRGPHDLLSIVGLGTWELAHSAALGWLCDPEASHGLGYAFVDGLSALCGAELTHGPIQVVTEEARLVVLDGREHDTRADVVVRGPGWTLIIEVKVNAGEQPLQAHRLHEGWKDEPGAQFVFLTRYRGLRPRSAPEAVQEEWTPISWRQVAETLQRASDAGKADALGRQAVEQYLLTIQSTF